MSVAITNVINCDQNKEHEVRAYGCTLHRYKREAVQNVFGTYTSTARGAKVRVTELNIEPYLYVWMLFVRAVNVT